MTGVCYSSLAFLCGFISTALAVCPNGWTRYDSVCYALFEGGAEWNDASTLCREFGGHLATLDTTAKIQNAKEFMDYINHKINVWIGGSDIGLEGMWVWDLGQASISTTDWAKGEPDSGTRENCLMMSAGHHHQWADAPCSNKYDYLCERVSTPMP